MADIVQSYTIKVSPEKVYEALTQEAHLKLWWTPDCKAECVVGGTANFEFNPFGDYCNMKVTKLEENELVEWNCVESTMMKTKDWVGTTIRFELSANDEDGTNLNFIHSGWASETDCYKKCVDGWAHFLGESLKAYLETGKGQPFDPNKDMSKTA